MQRLFAAPSPLARSAGAALHYKSPRFPSARPPSLFSHTQVSTQLYHTKLSNTRNMSSAIVLPSLTAWAEQRLTALFTTTDEQSFDAAFDAFVAADTTSIVVNGQKLSREQYKQQTWKDKFLEAGAQVQYLGAVSVPSDPSEPVKVCLRSLLHRRIAC